LRFLIGEIGLAAILLIGACLGIHVVLLVICGWRIATLFYWLWLIVPAICMASIHPNIEGRRPGRLR
jgi:hypothetical protein